MFCVGFAAETTDRDHHAKLKLRSKGIDMIAANWVGPAADETQGCFGSDLNALKLYWHNGDITLPLTSKQKLARQLVTKIAERFHIYDKSQNTSNPNVVTLQKTGLPK